MSRPWGTEVAAIAIALGAACGSAQGAPPDWIGTDDALRSGVMTGEPGEGLTRDAVQDDAIFAYLAGSTACFDVVVRAAQSDDVPLSRIGATCVAGEANSPAEPASDEIVSVYDYAESGEVGSVVAEDVTAESWSGSSSDPPGSGLTRAIERRTRLCCEVGLADTVTLSVGSLALSWDMR